jgi:hypothetical protein
MINFRIVAAAAVKSVSLDVVILAADAMVVTKNATSVAFLYSVDKSAVFTDAAAVKMGAAAQSMEQYAAGLAARMIARRQKLSK